MTGAATEATAGRSKLIDTFESAVSGALMSPLTSTWDAAAESAAQVLWPRWPPFRWSERGRMRRRGRRHGAQKY